mmetsp:Transcript_30982/g.86801  ORF Transcript_30982/g.86801 Transcript_30982/m.86801 type:complete len:213 (-) Transcript_30982:309-947(-)
MRSFEAGMLSARLDHFNTTGINIATTGVLFRIPDRPPTIGNSISCANNTFRGCRSKYRDNKSSVPVFSIPLAIASKTATANTVLSEKPSNPSSGSMIFKVISKITPPNKTTSGSATSFAKPIMTTIKVATVTQASQSQWSQIKIPATIRSATRMTRSTRVNLLFQMRCLNLSAITFGLGRTSVNSNSSSESTYSSASKASSSSSINASSLGC